MFRNYLAATLRNLVRNKLYATINVVGLAVAFSAALLIAIFVRDELSFDTWISEYGNVYRLAKTMHPPGGAKLATDGSSPAEAAWFRSDLPEVIAATRIWPDQRGLRRGNFETIDPVAWVDQHFFKVFPLPVFDGPATGALDGPDSAVITRSMARKYFGTDRAVGQLLEIDRTYVVRVTAVLEDIPSRSHLDFGILLSDLSSFSLVNTMEGAQLQAVGFGPILSYLRVAPGAIESIRAAAPAVVDRHTKPWLLGGKESVPASTMLTYDFQPLAAIHMIPQVGRSSQTHYGLMRPSGDPGVVTALVITGALIVFVAVANFANLMAARAPRRATEIGVRKAVGARRPDLMVQFLGESFLHVGFALIAALICVQALLPAVAALLGREIGMDGAAGMIVAISAALLIFTGLLGGLYPSFVLARLRPASALKGPALTIGGAGGLREILVIAQFAILIGLLVATVTIGRQTAFTTRSALRMESDPLLFSGSPCTPNFRDRVAALPSVRGAACVTGTLFGGNGGIRLMPMRDGSRFNLHLVGADPGALELYGATLLAGRLFRPGDEERPKNPQGVISRRIVINDTARTKMGFPSPQAALGFDPEGWGYEIVGVVSDFVIANRSPRDAVEAVSFVAVGAMGGLLTMDQARLLVKVDGARIPDSVQGIEAIWSALDVDRPLALTFLDQHVEAQYRDLTRQTEAFNTFSLASVFIACLGLFGLSAHRAESRTKEIGIRKTMGASSGDVLKLLLWQFTRPVLWANLIAWPVAYLIMRRWLEGFAYRIELTPWIFLLASTGAIVIAVATVIGHALLVARARPVTALRYE